MSWFLSLALAGITFASNSGFPIQNNVGSYVETSQKQIVRLDETERFEQTYPLNANGKVSVSNVNGSITIEAWDRNEVKLVAIKTADTRERLSDVKIKIDSRPDRIDIETDYDSDRRNNSKNNYEKLEVQYQLTVPRTAVLDEIEAVNGSVIVSNMTNFTKVSAVNGTVRATNLRGTANLSTVNGTVDADFSNLQTGSQISLSTVNGRANLLIPSDANATIKADSVNGNILNDFGLPVRKGQYVGRDLYGRVGSGDVRIKLDSVNGDLSVKRKQDGRTVNPATNLLNQLTSDDEGENIAKAKAEAKADAKVARNKRAAIASDSVYVNVPEINAEVQKEMQKQMSKAQADITRAQAQMSKELIDVQIKESIKIQQAALDRLRSVNWVGGSTNIEKKSDTFPVKGVPKITIEGGKSAVYVRGWDKQEVGYSVVRMSRMPNNSALDVKVDHTDSEVKITVPQSASATGGTPASVGSNIPRGIYFVDTAPRMRVEVYVPKKSNLRIHTEGEIRLENISGELDVRNDGGQAINVRDSEGSLRVATDAGRIRVIGFRGALDARSDEGTMNLEGEFQDFNVRTKEGKIILTLPENANALFQSDAEIIGEGFEIIHEDEQQNIWQIGKGGGKKYRFTGGNGNIIIRSSSQIAALSK